LGGIAIERRVVGDHRGHVALLKPELLFPEVAGHDGQRAYVAELGGDALFQHWLVRAPPSLLLGYRRAPHDAVVSLVRPGDVNVVDTRMVAEVLANLGSAVDHAQVAAGHERSESLLEERSHPLV